MVQLNEEEEGLRAYMDPPRGSPAGSPGGIPWGNHMGNSSLSLKLHLTLVLTPTDRCSCPRVRVLASGVGWRLARPDPGMVGAQTGPDHVRVGVVA